MEMCHCKIIMIITESRTFGGAMVLSAAGIILCDPTAGLRAS